MNKPVLVVQIVALMVAIFACGFWAGRTTAPESPLLPEEESVAGVERMVRRATSKVLRRYSEELGLTVEQQITLTPLFKEVGMEMAKYPTRSPERMRVLEEFHERIAPHLTDGQRETSAEILERSRAKR